MLLLAMQRLKWFLQLKDVQPQGPIEAAVREELEAPAAREELPQQQQQQQIRLRLLLRHLRGRHRSLTLELHQLARLLLRWCLHHHHKRNVPFRGCWRRILTARATQVAWMMTTCQRHLALFEPWIVARP